MTISPFDVKRSASIYPPFFYCERADLSPPFLTEINGPQNEAWLGRVRKPRCEAAASSNRGASYHKWLSLISRPSVMHTPDVCDLEALREGATANILFTQTDTLRLGIGYMDCTNAARAKG